jgi:hypothetical protein
MKRSLLLFATTTAVVLLCTCSGEKKSHVDRSDRQAQIKASFYDYATQKGASADWEKALPGKAVAWSYTFQLEDALLASRGAIAVRATLHDVRRKGDTFYLSLQSDDDVFFRLRATPDQVSRIVKQGPAMFDEYAIIVQVTGVERPEFKAKAEPDADTGQRVEVEFSDMVVITGECIDLQFLDGLPPALTGKSNSPDKGDR